MTSSSNNLYTASDLRPVTNLAKGQGDHVSAYRLITALGETLANHDNPGGALCNLFDGILSVLKSERNQLPRSNNELSSHSNMKPFTRKAAEKQDQSADNAIEHIAELEKCIKYFKEKLETTVAHVKEIEDNVKKISALSQLGLSSYLSSSASSNSSLNENKSKIKKRVEDILGHLADETKKSVYSAMIREFLDKFIELANKQPFTAFSKNSAVLQPLNNEGNIISGAVKRLKEINEEVKEGNRPAPGEVAQLLLNLFWYPCNKARAPAWLEDIPEEKRETIDTNQHSHYIEFLCRAVVRHLDYALGAFPYLNKNEELLHQTVNEFMDKILGQGKIVDKQGKKESAVEVGWNLSDDDKKRAIKEIYRICQVSLVDYLIPPKPKSLKTIAKKDDDSLSVSSQEDSDPDSDLSESNLASDHSSDGGDSVTLGNLHQPSEPEKPVDPIKLLDYAAIKNCLSPQSSAATSPPQSQDSHEGQLSESSSSSAPSNSNLESDLILGSPAAASSSTAIASSSHIIQNLRKGLKRSHSNDEDPKDETVLSSDESDSSTRTLASDDDDSANMSKRPAFR